MTILGKAAEWSRALVASLAGLAVGGGSRLAIGALGKLMFDFVAVGQKLMERRVEQPYHHRQAVHHLEEPLKIADLQSLELAFDERPQRLHPERAREVPGCLQ